MAASDIGLARLISDSCYQCHTLDAKRRVSVGEHDPNQPSHHHQRAALGTWFLSAFWLGDWHPAPVLPPGSGLTMHGWNMAALVRGVKTRVIPQSEETGTMDRYGVDTLTRVEEIPAEIFPGGMRGIGSGHPRYRNMAVSKVNYTVGKHGKFYRVTYIYEGFMLSLPDPTYELDISTGAEPIQTHPDFVAFAGTPATPLNGSVFVDPDSGKPTSDDAKGIWKEFKFQPAVTGRQSKAAVTDYFTPGSTWTEISFSSTRPSDRGDVGKIDTPSGSPPALSDGATWLYAGMTYTKRGSIYEVRKTWKASGRGGWDADIYGA